MNEKITAYPQKEEREKVLKEIRQLENRQKILENKQRNEERKARTRRLIERGAQNPGTRHKSLVYKGALIHRCRCCAPCRGALRTSSAMGSYAPQTPCALCEAKHPLCVCLDPQSLLSPH